MFYQNELLEYVITKIIGQSIKLMVTDTRTTKPSLLKKLINEFEYIIFSNLKNGLMYQNKINMKMYNSHIIRSRFIGFITIS